ncbi:YD repeat-containing protein [Pseudomonas syringae pv. primulae]|uniref:YD repeat-containing protein n=2 Tax=Pseudomonas syringae group genomosp. 3 TaxID=251701 RepID=A0A3M5U5X2_9PSED|nr:YD repeat-containing protein [Pseudomonas syringae pv. primulae]RMU40934.1 YD repeat-containing protein [Pseudomonas syringae pv. primulae]
MNRQQGLALLHRIAFFTPTKTACLLALLLGCRPDKGCLGLSKTSRHAVFLKDRVWQVANHRTHGLHDCQAYLRLYRLNSEVCPMAASTSVHSNALNFMSSLKSGVDPRTGLYNVSINLPELQSNDLLGPGFNLDLSYSPLNKVDSGYGRGWNLQLSQYNPGTRILALSTGETFCADGTSGTALTMSEKKLDTFHFYKLDATHYRVVHKSGLVEMLEVHYSGTRQMAWPVKIIAPSGHSITLKHRPFSSTQYMLASITDDLDQTLLQLSRSSTSVDLALHPYAGPGGAPLARYVMNLGATDKGVSSIILPDEQRASWRFEYELKTGDQLVIKRVDTPSGGREDISYLDGGHSFPSSANRPALPRVTRHVTDPGAGQAKIDVRYTYRDNQQRSRNFLGAGLPINWEDNGLDNLYKYLQDYDYVCTESLWVEDRQVRTVERTFNRFHLQTLEVTTQNDHQKTLATTYNIRAGVPYASQPNDCQLPSKTVTRWQLLNEPARIRRKACTRWQLLKEPARIRRKAFTRWQLLKEPARIRSETVTHTYDKQGNVLVHKRADGIEEVSSWYPAQASDGCPADAEGFVCRLKERMTRPAPATQAGAPTLSTRYRYESIRTLDGSKALYWIVPEGETLLEVNGNSDVELQQIRIEHIDKPDKPFEHGRTSRHIQTLNSRSTFTRYAYSKFNEKQPGGPMLSITQTIETDFDRVSKTAVYQRSTLTGQNLLIDEDGVQTQYAYDALDRLTLETIAAATPYKASREYQYTLCNVYGQQAEQVLINARGVKTRSGMDGLGRTVIEERDHVDDSDPQALKQIFTAQYDAWNNLEQEAAHDRLANQLLTNTRRYHYDDWNQQCCVTTDDGVQTYECSDPIGNGTHQGPVQKTWVQSSDPEPLISGRSETWLNLFGKPDRIINQNAAEQQLSDQTFLYDGLGRCTEQRDTRQRRTLFRYDSWSRMVSTTLPDTSVINRSYALQSSDELPTALEVVHQDGTTRTQAGRQEFDGLGRLTLTETGDRIEQFAYDAGQMQATSRKTARGDDINFTYTLALTDQIVSSAAPDEKADFDYDNISARLTGAQNPQGKRAYAYDIHSQLQEETWADRQGHAWQTLHQSSLLGRPIKRTDLKQGDDAGMETVYGYDALGRVESIAQGDLLTTIAHDTLGQLDQVTTRDLASNTTVIIKMEYDDQGQETLRTHTATNQPLRTLTQEWEVDGLLKTRHLQQAGSSLLHETFSYDPRGRLTRVVYLGSTLPRDELAREMTRQVFSFDELDNLTLCQTQFANNPSERATFNYGSQDNPINKDRCQLLGVTYEPPRAEPGPTFSYDDNGNQLNDEHGNSLHYDSQSRLQRVEKPGGMPISQYRYDGHDHLLATQDGTDSEVLRFYQGQQLSNSVQDDQRTHYLHLEEQPLGQQVVGDPEKTLLLLTDANQSVLGECQQDQLRTAVYSAYGERYSDDALRSTAGFNGEVRETANGWYLLGNGYRAYNPSLMRFHSPDFLSPFAEGGVNPYTYCLGNPIALRDPTGHDASSQSGRLRRPDEDALPMQQSGGSNIMAWVGVAVGVAFTVAGVSATIASFGAATPLTAPLTVLGVSMSAASAGAIATTSLAIGTALGAVATGAVAYGTATGDQTAYKIGEYTGYASIPFGLVGGFASSAVKGALKAASKATMGVAKAAPSTRTMANAAVFQGATKTSISAVDWSNIESRAAGILKGLTAVKTSQGSYKAPFLPASSSGGVSIPRAWITPKSARPSDPNVGTLMSKVHKSNLENRQSIIRNI